MLQTLHQEGNVQDSNYIKPGSNHPLADLRFSGLSIGSILLTVLLTGLLYLPQSSVFPAASSVAWHALLEVLAVVLSLLIFAVSWHAQEQQRPSVMVVLGCSFLGVALLDLFHALSLPGMPHWVTPAGAAKATYFWLAARILLAGTMLLVAWGPWHATRRLAKVRAYSLGSVLLLVLAVTCWVLSRSTPAAEASAIGNLPDLLTTSTEITITVLYLTAALGLFRRRAAPAAFNVNHFWVAAICMAVAESFFAWDKRAGESMVLIGHLVKLAAYILIYRAVLNALLLPWRRLAESEIKFRSNSHELEALFRAAVDGVMLVDAEGTIQRLSPSLGVMFGYDERALLGNNLETLIVVSAREQHHERWHSYMQNRRLQSVAIHHAILGQRLDGSVFPAEITFSPVTLDNERHWTMAVVRNVSKREAILAHLRASEASFRGYVETTPDWIWELDTYGRYAYSSPRVRDMLGYDPNELLGKKIREQMASWPDQQFVEIIEAAIQCPAPIVGLNVAWPHKAGHQVLLEINCVPHLAADGQLQGFHCIGRDVTQRKRDQQALLHSESRFRLAFNYAPIGMALVDSAWRWLRANQALTNICGYSEEALLKLNMRSLLHPDDIVLMQRFIASLDEMKVGMPAVELRLLHRSGHYIWGSLTASWAAGNDNTPGYYVLQLMDITQRRAAEKRIRLLSSIVDQSKDFVCMADPGGRIEYLNPSARNALGLAAGQHTHATDLTDLHPPATVRQLLGRVLPEVQRNGFWEGESVWLTQDGRTIPTLQTVQSHCDIDGNIEYWSTIAHDISERKLFEAQLLQQATHDALTGLPNRSLLHQSLVQAMASARSNKRLLAVMFIDLDDFKKINELFGHKTGDELIQQVSKRLRESMPESDTLARQGGDSFIAVLTDIPFMHDIIALAEKMLAELVRPFKVAHRDIFVGASLGISVFPFDNDSPEELLRQADVAVCRAKESSRRGYQFYTSDMDEEVRQAVVVESELRHALARNELVLHLQPLIDIQQNRVLGAESLIRWQHPQRGLLLPAQFIPIAEQSGLIIELGEWVIKEVCRISAVLAARLPQPLRMAINISAQQLLQGDLTAPLKQAMEQHGVAPAQLMLEMTEAAMIQAPDNLLAILNRIRALGIKIALDDFGTGYSSLANLQRFPIDVLKIDRTLVADIAHNPDDLAIVRALMQMTKAWDMQMVAEGVETAEQIRMLNSGGCHLMQGFYFGKAVTLEEFVDAVENRQFLLNPQFAH